MNNIPAALRATAYCTALRNGEQAEFDFLFNQLKADTSSSSDPDLINGLACANQNWQLERFLNDRLSSNKSKDTVTGLKAIITKTPSYMTAWAFMKENWDQLTYQA
jgi:aminopeptidase N